MSNRIIRVVTRSADGNMRTKEFDSFEAIEASHEQIGIDDCSTDLELRGMPIFRGLVGPIPDGKTAVRYESPEVFEVLTKEWTKLKAKRRRRRSAQEMAEAKAAAEAEAALSAGGKGEKQASSPPTPKFPFGATAPMSSTSSLTNS
jgi:hypothetical protein